MDKTFNFGKNKETFRQIGYRNKDVVLKNQRRRNNQITFNKNRNYESDSNFADQMYLDDNNQISKINLYQSKPSFGHWNRTKERIYMRNNAYFEKPRLFNDNIINNFFQPRDFLEEKYKRNYYKIERNVDPNDNYEMEEENYPISRRSRMFHKNKYKGFIRVNDKNPTLMKNKFNENIQPETKILNPITNNNLNIYNLIETPTSNKNKIKFEDFGLLNKKEFEFENKIIEPTFKKIKKNNETQIFNTIKDDKSETLKKEDGIINAEFSNNYLLSFDNLNSENKRKFDSLKHDFFELIEAFNLKNKSHIKVTWKENNPKIRFEETFESSLLKDKIDTSKIYTKKSDKFEPSMVNNVKWNSFLRSPSKLEFLTQTQKTISKILSYLENNQKEIIYHQNNIITLVNLQIPLCNSKFQNLSKQIKLRVICMLFAKYVNRKTLSYICQDFMESIDITDNNQIKHIILK